MMLGELIKRLEQAPDLDAVIPHGFGQPTRYCPSYDEVTFEQAQTVTVRSMLEHAKVALAGAFASYESGECSIGEGSNPGIGNPERTDADSIGPTLIKYLTGDLR